MGSAGFPAFGYAVVMPVLEPDARLSRIARAVTATLPRLVVVVDDGSSARSAIHSQDLPLPFSNWRSWSAQRPGLFDVALRFLVSSESREDTCKVLVGLDRVRPKWLPKMAATKRMAESIWHTVRLQDAKVTILQFLNRSTMRRLNGAAPQRQVRQNPQRSRPRQERADVRRNLVQVGGLYGSI